MIVFHSISLSCGKMKAIATPYCFHRIRGRIEVSQLCGRRSNLTGNKSPFVITFSYRDSIARSRNVELKIRHVKCCRDSKIYVQDEILFYISVSLHRLSVDFFQQDCNYFGIRYFAITWTILTIIQRIKNWKIYILK